MSRTAYGETLDANDAAEAAQPTLAEHSGDAAKRLAALLEKRAAAQADMAKLDASGQTQLSRTDADARLLSKTVPPRMMNHHACRCFTSVTPVSRLPPF